VILCYIEMFFLHYSGPRAPPVVPVLDRARGRACGGRAQARGGRGERGRAGGRGQVSGAAVPVWTNSLECTLDNDCCGMRRLRLLSFLTFFFTVQLINNIVTHTNSLPTSI